MSYSLSNLIAHINVYVYKFSGMDAASREGVCKVMDKVGVYQPDKDRVTEHMDSVYDLTKSEGLAAMAGVVFIRNGLEVVAYEDDDWS